MPVKVLGIDPGIATMGYALLVAGPQHGQLRLDAHGHFAKRIDPASQMYGDGGRLRNLEDSLINLIVTLQPTVVVYEAIFQGKGNPGQTTQAVRIGKAIGLLEKVACEQGIAIIPYAPTSIFAVVRHINRRLGIFATDPASRTEKKHWVGEVVRAFFGLQKTLRPHHVSDAVAVALCHLWKEHHEQVKGYLEQLGGKAKTA